MTRFSPSIFVAAAMLLAGCTTHYAYTPQPAITMLRTNPPQPAEQARIVVNAVGTKPASNHPSTVDVTIRIENIGPNPLSFDPREVSMLDLGLHPLGGPSGDLQPATIEPGQALVRGLQFALPPHSDPDDSPFSTLNLRFTLRVGAGAFTHSMLFYRVDYYPYYYYGPYPGYGYGYGYRYWW